MFNHGGAEFPHLVLELSPMLLFVLNIDAMKAIDLFFYCLRIHFFFFLLPLLKSFFFLSLQAEEEGRRKHLKGDLANSGLCVCACVCVCVCVRVCLFYTEPKKQGALARWPLKQRTPL